MQREGWNGKGLFIFQQIPAEIDVKRTVSKMQSLPQSVKNEFERRFIDNKLENDLNYSESIYGSIRYKNQFAVVYPDNTIHGWVESPSDTLEEDWVVLD